MKKQNNKYIQYKINVIFVVKQDISNINVPKEISKENEMMQMLFIEKIVKLEEEKYEIQQKYNNLINEVRKNYKI